MPTMTEETKVQRYGPVVARMNSSRNPEKIYDVRLLNGHYSCNCPGFIFQKQCKHTRHAASEGLTDEASHADVHLQFECFVIDDVLKAGGIKKVNGQARERMAECLTKYLAQAKAEAVNEKSQPKPLLVGGARMITLDE